MKLENRKIAAPQPSLETQLYWDGAKQGKLMVKHCAACNKTHHYPRAICPHCFSDRTEWKEAKGTGTIYSFSFMRRAQVPYVMAYVTLDEGSTMMTNIVDCDSDQVRIGMKVRVVFKPTEGGGAVPMFAPA